MPKLIETVMCIEKPVTFFARTENAVTIFDACTLCPLDKSTYPAERFYDADRQARCWRLTIGNVEFCGWEKPGNNWILLFAVENEKTDDHPLT